MIHEWIWSIGGIILTGETEGLGGKRVIVATLSTTNATWTKPGANHVMALVAWINMNALDMS
jgi:hypothetical protein